ncbi:CAP domain-containing protein [Labedaea rhizosphaerae]|uniref:Uncharacterized protein YkwD n=1 Tax=Labedaea rhizosphaerae TaxID=598644 RepID=A0A4R6SCW8_LABRH|nr:CAP domain-containing protein [Labedaea rhizosphaerae]TDP97427.1 uncharacterized protein YkwD [Labedaea rhizosphaerae]
MTFDRGRRAPVLAGLVALAIGALTAGGATALRHNPTSNDTRGEVSYAAEVQGHVLNGQAGVRPSLIAVPGPAQGGAPNAPRTTKPPTTTSTTKPTTTTTKPTTSTTSPTTTNANRNASQTDQVLSIVNQERADAGCAPLRADSRLAAAAQGHSSDMSRRDYFSHTTPEGKTFDVRIKEAGYAQPGAENIAMGQRSAAEVMDAWMHSDGHRRNILNCDLTAIGIGLDTDGWYWTQDFGY